MPRSSRVAPSVHEDPALAALDQNPPRLRAVRNLGHLRDRRLPARTGGRSSRRRRARHCRSSRSCRRKRAQTVTRRRSCCGRRRVPGRRAWR
eukprot:1533501-Pyramimonas_sp.AAC.1